MKTLLVDFDGVIHSYTSGWIQHNIIPDPPVKGAIEFIIEAVEHFDVNIYSARSRNTFGIVAMQNWFAEHGMPDTIISRLRFPDQKPPAFLTLDDRCICFTGEFPTMDTLKAFKTWMEKKEK